MLGKLFTLLSTDEFQDPASGMMSFPAYVYVYPPAQEYELRGALPDLRERLKRPNVGQEALLTNVYEQFIEYLSGKTLGGETLLNLILETEEEEPEKAHRQLRRHASSSDFVEHLAEQFVAFVQGESERRRSYVFVSGWGSVYPFLRASRFLDKMEPHLRGYKLILFYPGTYEGGQFRLFGTHASNRVYRASCLNELV